jgi:hypothetical protein
VPAPSATRITGLDERILQRAEDDGWQGHSRKPLPRVRFELGRQHVHPAGVISANLDSLKQQNDAADVELGNR